MEPKDSLIFSQVSVTSLYPESDEVSPHSHLIPLKSILILSSHLLLGLPGGVFFSRKPVTLSCLSASYIGSGGMAPFIPKLGTRWT
jgi:hypothetical protein